MWEGFYWFFVANIHKFPGSRFALMEVKAVMYYMVLKYKFVPNNDSQIPLKLIKNPAILRVEGGLNLQMVPRV